MPAKARTTAPDAWPKGSSASSRACFTSPEPEHQVPLTPASIASCAEAVSYAISQARPVALVCDHTLEGVLAGVGIIYLAHAQDGQVRLVSSSDAQPRLGEAVVRAPSSSTDATVAFARRVLVGFAGNITRSCKRRCGGSCPSTCDNACVQRIVLACASDDLQMPQIVNEYLRLGFATGPRVRQMIADERIVAFDGLARYVLGECEHTRQFVRFSHMADRSFAASFSPSADTIPLTASHFAARMSTERFFLVDPRHRVVAFHDPSQRGCQIVRLDQAIANDLANRSDIADDERYVRAMWQRFYRGTATPGRGKDQRGYDLRTSWMPQRLWNGLSELGVVDERATLEIPARYAGNDAHRLISGAN